MGKTASEMFPCYGKCMEETGLMFIVILIGSISWVEPDTPTQ